MRHKNPYASLPPLAASYPLSVLPAQTPQPKSPPKAPPKAPRGQPLPLSQAPHYGRSVPAPDSFGRPQDFIRFVDPDSAEGQARQHRFLDEIAAHNARQRKLFGGGDGNGV